MAHGAKILLMICFIYISQANAAQNEENIGTFGKHWQVYTVKDGNTLNACYVMGTPQKMTGQYKKRGASYLSVKIQADSDESPIISFIAGYDIKPKSPITVQSNAATFELYVPSNGIAPGTAWAGDDKTEKSLINAAKRGKSLTIKGVSQKGTQTTDTYDLKGFSNAYATMMGACGQASAATPVTDQRYVSALKRKPSAFTDRSQDRKRARQKKRTAQPKNNPTVFVDAGNWTPKKKIKTATTGTQASTSTTSTGTQTRKSTATISTQAG